MYHVRQTLQVDRFHQRGLTGEGIGIAIIDSGLCLHPDFRSRIVGWYDPLTHSSRPYDDSGHGSHVAGIAAGDGYLSQGRYTGIAPKASLIGVKVLDRNGDGSIANTLRGIRWVLQNHSRLRIHIVNISIGANGDDAFCENSDLVWQVNQLWDNGIVVVAAAGNRGPGRYTISAPGNSRKIITVGSSDTWYSPGQKKQSQSGSGPTLACIKKPDVVVPGSHIVSCSHLQNGKWNSAYSMKSGTSMSTPIVSGAIALLLSRHPDLSPKEIKVRLKNSSTDLHLPHAKQGWGLIDLNQFLS